MSKKIFKRRYEEDLLMNIRPNQTEEENIIESQNHDSIKVADGEIFQYGGNNKDNEENRNSFTPTLTVQNENQHGRSINDIAGNDDAILATAANDAEELAHNIVFTANLINEEINEMKKLRRKEHVLTYDISHNLNGFLPNLMQCGDAIDNLYESILKRVFNRPEYDVNDVYTVHVNKTGDLTERIFIGSSTLGKINKSEFINRIFKVCQSKQEFLIGGKLEIQVNVIKHLEGGTSRSFKNKAPINVDNEKERMRSIIKIKNSDNSCGYRAVFIGIKFHELNVARLGASNKHIRYQWLKVIASKFPNYQTKETQKLCNDANINFHSPMGDEERKKFNNIYLRNTN